MGGVEPTRGYVLELLPAGKPVVTANKQLLAQRGAELFAAASAAGVQLRFEASVCAAIPVIKVLREALVVSNVHRVLGIVNVNPGIHAGQQGHEPGGVQIHLLVGMGPSLPGPLHRRGLCLCRLIYFMAHPPD